MPRKPRRKKYYYYRVHYHENGKPQHVHRMLAEKALGHLLPPKAEVHHVNDIADNSALVICPDRAYHMLIHYRQRALEASGNANYLKCEHCKKFDDPANNMWVHPRITRAYHRTCHAEAAARRKFA